MARFVKYQIFSMFNLSILLETYVATWQFRKNDNLFIKLHRKSDGLCAILVEIINGLCV